jgi:hypothetical protein
MCIVSMPTIRMRARRNFSNPSIGRVIPFDGLRILFEDVVEVPPLAHFDAQAAAGPNARNGDGVGAAFVDGDFPGYVVTA